MVKRLTKDERTFSIGHMVDIDTRKRRRRMPSAKFGNLQYIKVLGTGSNAWVFEVMQPSTGERCALRVTFGPNAENEARMYARMKEYANCSVMASGLPQIFDFHPYKRTSIYDLFGQNAVLMKMKKEVREHWEMPLAGMSAQQNIFRWIDGEVRYVTAMLMELLDGTLEHTKLSYVDEKGVTRTPRNPNSLKNGQYGITIDVTDIMHTMSFFKGAGLCHNDVAARNIGIIHHGPGRYSLILFDFDQVADDPGGYKIDDERKAILEMAHKYATWVEGEDVKFERGVPQLPLRRNK